MPQHHSRTKDHCRGVRSVGAHEVAGHMSASRLKQSVFLKKGRSGPSPGTAQVSWSTHATDVTTRYDPRPTDQRSTDVRDDGAVPLEAT